MPTQTQPQVGDGVRLTPGGHSPRSPECAIVMAVLDGGRRTVLRLRWCDGHQTFLPVNAVQAAM